MGGFIIKVEVKPCTDVPSKGDGVFTLEPVKAGTIMWQPDLVTKIPQSEVASYLESMGAAEAHVALRQAFVTREDEGSLCVNPNDLGRFMNHEGGGRANCLAGINGGAATRDIEAGEELTCDYSGLACPSWYQELCGQYGVLSRGEVVRRGLES